MQDSLHETHENISILMARSFTEFGKTQREEFLNDLSDLIAYPCEEFHEVKFWDGCVKFSALLPIIAVARILETLEKTKNKKAQNSEEVKEMQGFLDKHSITAFLFI